MTPPTRRIHGFLGRTSLWPLAGIGVLLALVPSLRYVAAGTAGDWWWSYNAMAGTLSLVIVVTAFVAGWDSGASGSGVCDLQSRGPVRLWAAPVLRAVTSLWPVVVADVLAVAALAVLTVSHGGRVDWRIGYVLPDHLMMICVASAIGTFLGSHLRSAPASIAAAAVGGTLAFVAGAPGQQLFGLNGGSAPVVGFVPSAGYFLWNLTALLGAAIALLWTERRRTERVGLAPGLCFLALVLCNSLLGPSTTFVPSGESASKCFTSSVEVCVFPGYQRVGEAASVQVDTLLRLAQQYGVPPGSFPARYVQQGGGSSTQAGAGTLVVPINALRTKALSPLAVADSISAPTWCPELFADEFPVALLEARQLILDWLLYVGGDLPREHLAEEHPRFAALSPGQQAHTIIAALRGLRQCNG